MTKYVLTIDQGTTSSRAILFDRDFRAIATAQQEFPQHFPDSGWVEHDCGDIWNTVLESCRKAMKQAGAVAGDIAAIGITNQRETTVVWDRRTGEPIHRAIVWQDRRTASICERLRNGGHEVKVAARTGLLLDPYFSGTKIAWILDHVEGARDLAEAGHLAFGTIDCFLIWKLTGGRVHRTDATNASRTLLYNIHDNDWDPELLSLFNIPAGILPEVMDCAADFGETDPDLLGGAIRITGVAGDQQAATVGQACFRPGMLKSTYGTGCFALLNTGQEAVSSHNRLLTTIAYRLDGRTTYALEGSIFVAGAAVQWLRDGLGVIEQAGDSDGLAAGADDHQQVYLVPAFTGLGAPHWDAGARGALYGLTRGTGPKELARAALEAVCYQTRDLLEAMYRDWSPDRDSRTVLRVDGGMSASNWTMQFLADILNARVDRPVVMETTALGAAWLAGSHVGFYGDVTSFAEKWQLDQHFDPAMDEAVRSKKFAGWQDALRRTLTG